MRCVSRWSGWIYVDFVCSVPPLDGVPLSVGNLIMCLFTFMCWVYFIRWIYLTQQMDRDFAFSVCSVIFPSSWFDLYFSEYRVLWNL